MCGLDLRIEQAISLRHGRDKTADVDAFVARPDPARPVVLVFGPDAGLVSERVNALVKASVDDPNDPFALARLEGEDLPPIRHVWSRRRRPCRCSAAAARYG